MPIKFTHRAWRKKPATRTQRGSSAVELALVMPLFLLLFFGVLDFSLLFFTNLTMQHAVREGGRYAITGAAGKDGREEAVIQKIKDSSAGMYAKVSPVLSVNGVKYPEAVAGMFGAGGTIVTLQLDCSYTLATPFVGALFSGGVYKFKVATTMKNEGFGL